MVCSSAVRRALERGFRRMGFIGAWNDITFDTNIRKSMELGVLEEFGEYMILFISLRSGPLRKMKS